MLAAALKGNKTLESLDLALNHVGDEGAKGFATSLQTNRTLLALNISEYALPRDSY